MHVFLILILLLLPNIDREALAHEAKLDELGNEAPCSLHGRFTYLDLCFWGASRTQVRKYGGYSLQRLMLLCGQEIAKLESYIESNDCGPDYRDFIVSRGQLWLKRNFPSDEVLDEIRDRGGTSGGDPQF